MHPQLRRQAGRGWWLAGGALLLAFGLWGLTVAPGALDSWTLWIVEVQRDLHRRLASAVQAVRDGGLVMAWPLVGLSFVYGVFHAAGPGHGKVVVATYITTQESRLPAALGLTAAASLAQALTAIVAVHVGVTILGLTLRQTRGGAMDLELLSFALIGALGAFLTVGALRKLRRPAHREACAHCGGHHHVAPEAVSSPWGAAGVVASIGLRPCSGALVVLLLAYAGGLPLVGVAAVLAMAIGTALTTGVLAALAVMARRTALNLARALPGEGGRTARWSAWAGLVGGLVLLALGLLLLQAAWTTPAHPFR